MKKKLKPRLKIALKTFIPLSATVVGLSVVSMQVASSTDSNKKQLIYENKAFSKADDIIKYLIDNKSLSIEDQKVMGDLGSSYSNYEKGLLNKELLPNYDVDKIKLAYVTAGGFTTPKHEEAVSSYFNPGLVETSYADSYGNVFKTQDDAMRSMNSSLVMPYMAYYKDIPTFNDDGSISTTERINPLEKSDVNSYSNNIKNNVVKIISNTLLDDAKGGYTAEIDESKLSENKKKIIEATPEVNFTTKVADKIKELEKSSDKKFFNKQSFDGSKISLYSEKERINLPWTSDDAVYLATHNWGDSTYWQRNSIRNFNLNWGIHKNSDESQELLSAKAQVHLHRTSVGDGDKGEVRFAIVDKNTKDFDAWDENTEVSKFDESYWGELNQHDMLKLINLDSIVPTDGLDRLMYVKNDGKVSAGNIDNLFSDFTEKLNQVSIDSKESIIDNYINSSPLFFQKNATLKTSFKKAVEDSKDGILTPSLGADRYVPDFHFSHNDFEMGRDYTYYVAYETERANLIRVKESAFNFAKKVTFAYPSKSLDSMLGVKNDFAKKLLHGLWTIKDTSTEVPIVIKKDGHKIFSTTIVGDLDKGVKIKDGTWKNISYENDLDATSRNLFQIMNIKGFADDKNKTFADILDALKVAQTQDSNKALNQLDFTKQYAFSEAVKQLAVQIRKMSEAAFNDDVKRFVGGRLPNDAENILYLGQTTVLSPGMYRYLGPNFANPSLGKGTFLPGDLLATNDGEKIKLTTQQFVTRPSEISVPYTSNGGIIDLGGYYFDGKELIRQNVLNTYMPKRDLTHVFIDDKMVDNVVLTIKHVALYGHDYYFDKYDNFYNFIIEFINGSIKKD